MNTIKNIKWLLPIIFATLITSCSEGFLDRAPTSALDQQKVFSDYQLTRKYQIDLYQTIRSGFSEFANGDYTSNWGYDLISNMDDHCMGSKNDNSTFEMITGGWMTRGENGNWGCAFEVARNWRCAYQAIRAINIFLENYKNTPLSTDEERLEMNNMVGEAYFLRAHHYFELVKRWGGVPLIYKVVLPSDDQRPIRQNINVCIDSIVSDCDKGAALMDVVVSSSQWLGRATKGAAMGLKARALLWGASPYWSSRGAEIPWSDAAEAALDVINLNAYSLLPIYRDVFLVPFNSEVIFCKNSEPRNMWDLYMWAPNFLGGLTYGNFQPTQEFVDCYEIKDTNTGLYVNFDRNNPDHVANMYNKDRRDPRFNQSLLYNGAKWQGITCEYYTGGNLGYQTVGSLATYIYTGYCFTKYWDENVLVGTVNGVPRKGNPQLNWVFLRYADILLMYAEAQNQAGGPNSSADGSGKTALWAINQVRQRAGISDLPTSISQADFDVKLRNERSVELCIEDQRFFDVRRWGIGDVLARDLHKVMCTKNLDGSFVYDFSQTVGPLRKKYDNPDQYILYPINIEEVQRNPNLTQNPGWQDIMRL